MGNPTPWDFRSEEDLKASLRYEEVGYVIEDADYQHLELMKKKIVESFAEFTKSLKRDVVELEQAHTVINHDSSNDLRLHIMQALSRINTFNKSYYYAAREIIHALCGNELAMQKRPGISINLPENRNDILPIHADTWNGVSPFELNIWIPFVDCSDSMCLYILKREHYAERLKNSKGLLKLSSDELFNELKEDLTWIPIQYGKILAFDQSLPHGYSLNKEIHSHWSMNCRFKGLHTPYWDKKLGEYFMPITVKSTTRIGLNYEHPENWI